jgi:SAM-dependent methyltransferase
MRSSPVPDFETNAAHYDTVAAGYDAQMSLHPSDVLARRAFVDLVGRQVSPGSTLLDFGCGTGLDAREYVRRGYRVLAYDHSPGMMARLSERCHSEIESGDITTCSDGYSSFLNEFPWSGAPGAVVSNFAVLNLIPDLEPLFETFARHLAPPGWVIVNILNPMHWTRLRTSAWWRMALRNGGQARVNLTRPYVSYLHFANDLLRAAPQFHLVGRANAGAYVRYDAVAPGTPRTVWWSDAQSDDRRLRRLAWHSAAHTMLGHFMFLVLRRDRP